ncbi:hypothetical protein RJT34_33311 [Clitoria ternatea]|uniref:Uncharacterized protein n=1 Tax=Clitoria ternatea TaxID=43366 RepID=A0AAN9I339_CLITE
MFNHGPMEALPSSSSPSFSFTHIAARVIHDDEDFQFSFVSNSSLVAADDIFYNGHILPSYPLPQTTPPHPPPRRLPLRDLMFQDRETRNDLHGVAEGTYCVWTPPSKKTTLKRWKLRDLLLRSQNAGKKEPVLFLGSGDNKRCPAAKWVAFFGNGHDSKPLSKIS